MMEISFKPKYSIQQNREMPNISPLAENHSVKKYYRKIDENV